MSGRFSKTVYTETWRARGGAKKRTPPLPHFAIPFSNFEMRIPFAPLGDRDSPTDLSSPLQKGLNLPLYVHGKALQISNDPCYGILAINIFARVVAIISELRKLIVTNVV